VFLVEEGIHGLFLEGLICGVFVSFHDGEE
jgi:hypothetical protein